jgi:hypothetical protein
MKAKLLLKDLDMVTKSCGWGNGVYLNKITAKNATI